ncbi:MAG: hypothetical protein H0T42_33875 [Deltaproteobacteria bacterium]|nr:hypothetical protein [Deltaproteobacteria bacterium]
MGWFVIASLLVVTACGAELGGTGQATPDASGGGGDGGVNVDAAIDALAVPTCANGRVIYLNFDGVTLTQGTSDATQNRAGWLQAATATAPAYRVGQMNRQADIAQVTAGIRAQLASFPITVVTARPATGQYVMIVFGGTAAQVASAFGGAVNRLDCGDVQRNDVAWISDGVTPSQLVVNYAVGAIGFGLGLTATTVPTDCMCGWDNQCTPVSTGPCTLTDNIPRDPAANQLCAGLTTQSETLAFTQAFCQ